MLLAQDIADFYESELAEADEVIQPSSLRDYRWPRENPIDVAQLTRLRSERDVDIVIAASTVNTIDLTSKDFLKNTRSFDTAQLVHFILTSSKFQMNPAGKLRMEPLWLDRIRRYVDAGEPIHMVYPLMCKIGNWAKQMSNVGPTAGEDATIFFFRHLNDLVQEIYEPGLRISVISDAALYNSAFCNPQVEVVRYMNAVQQSILTYAPDCVEFHDYVQLLAEDPHDYTEVHAHYQRLMCDDPRAVLGSIRASTLFESVKASINIRKFNMSYQDMRELFSADANRANRQWDVVDTMARIAMEELVSIRKACGDLNHFERRWPGHVRVSCHKDQKGGRWVIGLRPYPEYYGSSKLLPYHGVPVIRLDSKGRHKLDIVPEVMLRGREDISRVEDESGDTYFYDATDTDMDVTTLIFPEAA